MYSVVLEQAYQEKYQRYIRNKNKNTCMSYLIYYLLEIQSNVISQINQLWH